MSKLTDIEGRFRYSIDRLDGGQNTKDSPSKIQPNETPDSLNVTFDINGAASTRNGSAQFNTTIVGTCTVDEGIQYSGMNVIFANGRLQYTSSLTATTFNICTSSSGNLTTGNVMGATVYQNVLFFSDGANGPWKWTGAENFYNMGIAIPSAPTGSSNGVGSISTGTYYYAVSFINTQVVEGQFGSISAGIPVTTSAAIQLTGIPLGTTLQGVNKRFIYRADNASGPFRKVATISDNTTTTLIDTLANGGEGQLPIYDGTAPTIFNVVYQTNDRVFFPDGSNNALLRFTNYTNPYISVAENFEPFNNGDGETIQAIGSQDNLVTVWKNNRSWSYLLQDPSDDTTWIKQELPINMGIVGSKAWDKIENGIVFVGKRNNKITGIHILQGIQLIQTNDGRLRSENIGRKIELEILNLLSGGNNNFDPNFWANIRVKVFNNRIYLAYTKTGDTTNKRIYWFDLLRVGQDYIPGSWAPWDGIHAKCLFVSGSNLFAGDSDATGILRALEQQGIYNDSGSAINSYFWTKEIAGDDENSQTLDGYIKDLREIYIWYGRLGNYNMNLRYRVDGDSSNGQAYPINLKQGGSNWASMVYGVDPWGGTRTDSETRIPIGRQVGRKFQFRFDNQNTVNQGFKVNRIEVGMNLRRRR